MIDDLLFHKSSFPKTISIRTAESQALLQNNRCLGPELKDSQTSQWLSAIAEGIRIVAGRSRQLEHFPANP
jgi:hypothetical protein